jgi:hypothetical protein
MPVSTLVPCILTSVKDVGLEVFLPASKEFVSVDSGDYLPTSNELFALACSFSELAEEEGAPDNLILKTASDGEGGTIIYYWDGTAWVNIEEEIGQ